eukprot:gene20509-27299_t
MADGTYRLHFNKLMLDDNVALIVRLRPKGLDPQGFADSGEGKGFASSSERKGVESSGIGKGFESGGEGKGSESIGKGKGGGQGNTISQQLIHADKCSSFLVATTHIMFDPNKGDVKLGQVSELGEKHKSLSIIGGDFNLVPQSPIYNFIQEGELDVSGHRKMDLSGQVKGIGYKHYFTAKDILAKQGFGESGVLVEQGQFQQIQENEDLPSSSDQTLKPGLSPVEGYFSYSPCTPSVPEDVAVGSSSQTPSHAFTFSPSSAGGASTSAFAATNALAHTSAFYSPASCLPAPNATASASAVTDTATACATAGTACATAATACANSVTASATASDKAPSNLSSAISNVNSGRSSLFSSTPSIPLGSIQTSAPGHTFSTNPSSVSASSRATAYTQTAPIPIPASQTSPPCSAVTAPFAVQAIARLHSGTTLSVDSADLGSITPSPALSQEATLLGSAHAEEQVHSPEATSPGSAQVGALLHSSEATLLDSAQVGALPHSPRRCRSISMSQMPSILMSPQKMQQRRISHAGSSWHSWNQRHLRAALGPQAAAEVYLRRQSSSSQGGLVPRISQSEGDMTQPQLAQAPSLKKEASQKLPMPAPPSPEAPPMEDESLLAVHPLDLTSSYASIIGDEPVFTSSHHEFLGTCDYIWFTPKLNQNSSLPAPVLEAGSEGRIAVTQGGTDSSVRVYESAERELPQDTEMGSQPSLRAIAVLEPPHIEALPQGLPAPQWGSDHICLMTKFELSF